MRNRIIRKVGNSLYIKLEPTDIKDFNLEVHDLVDIEEALQNASSKKKHQKGEKKKK